MHWRKSVATGHTRPEPVDQSGIADVRIVDGLRVEVHQRTVRSGKGHFGEMTVVGISVVGCFEEYSVGITNSLSR
jgi:hypothetical protein